MEEKRTILNRPLHHKINFITFIGFLILSGFVIWSAFIKETKKVNIKVEKGGQADIDLREERKKLFIPAVSGGIRQWSDSGLETFIEARVTVEF